jgi:uncharacterized membrane protein YeiB
VTPPSATDQPTPAPELGPIVGADRVTSLDAIRGVLTMLFIDQKMMALFSIPFGVGAVIFADRAAAKGR